MPKMSSPFTSDGVIVPQLTIIGEFSGDQNGVLTGKLTRRADAGKRFCHGTHHKRVEQSKSTPIARSGAAGVSTPPCSLRNIRRREKLLPRRRRLLVKLPPPLCNDRITRSLLFPVRFGFARTTLLADDLFPKEQCDFDLKKTAFPPQQSRHQ